MSSPNYRLRLSSKAQRDVEHILRYTEKTWGGAQAVVYKEKLNAALVSLRANPLTGYRSADLPETHRLFPFGSHVIVYSVKADVIGVARILHQRMNVSRHVP